MGGVHANSIPLVGILCYALTILNCDYESINGSLFLLTKTTIVRGMWKIVKVLKVYESFHVSIGILYNINAFPQFVRLMGGRLMVGHWVLIPGIRVRVLAPQPNPTKTSIYPQAKRWSLVLESF